MNLQILLFSKTYSDAVLQGLFCAVFMTTSRMKVSRPYVKTIFYLAKSQMKWFGINGCGLKRDHLC